MNCSNLLDIDIRSQCPEGDAVYKRTATAWVEVETDNSDTTTGNVTKIAVFNTYGEVLRVITTEGESVNIIIPVEGRLKTCTITVGEIIIYPKYES